MLQSRSSLFRRLNSLSRLHQQSRFESSSSAGGSQAHSAHLSPHPKPVNEPLGRGFYIAIAVIPLSFALYKYSHSSADGEPPFLTRLISHYDYWQDRWATRNNAHTVMVEQAAHDRILFLNSRYHGGYELNFPEVFNTGSPYNVPAGHGVNLDELIAHYYKKNAETERKRVERMERRAKREMEIKEQEELAKAKSWWRSWNS